MVFLFYGNLSNQNFRFYYQFAQRFRGKFSSIFLSLLERRLDIALYRLNWAPSIQSSKQLINHKKVFINFQIVSSPSYLLQPGDIISLCPQSQKSLRKQYFSSHIEGASSSRQFLQKKALHFEVNYKTFQAIFLYSPQQVFFPGKINVNLLSQMKFIT